MSNSVTWPLEPHTKAKHDILKNYLGAWFPILTSRHNRILYVDGFAGPGEYDGGEKGSPVIALEVAIDHRLKTKLSTSKLVFYFIEEDRDRCENLKKQVAKLDKPSNFNIIIECDAFEKAFGSVMQYLDEQNKALAPAFIFIDPFGPTGFPMSLISRIANHVHSEVLINFNYLDLNRWFLQEPSKHQHIDNLYGNQTWREAQHIVEPDRKEEYLRKSYQESLESLGWKVRPFRMINKHNQTQYYLFFATSHPLGMSAMKQAMWSAAPHGDFKYSDLSNPQQACLFEKVYEEEYAEQLAKQLYNTHKGQVVPKKTLVQEDLAWHPICISRHLTQALKILENESTPTRIVNVEVPNRNRQKSSYPNDCTIQFANY